MASANTSSSIGANNPADSCPLPKTITGWGDTLNSKWTKVRSWCRTIQDKCVVKHNLDIDLVASVMMQESGGNPDAINSSSGATGLMQVMPDFAIPGRPSQSQLLDPELNIEEGCNILSENIGRYGSIRDGLWGYGGTQGTYAQYADIVLNVFSAVKASHGP